MATPLRDRSMILLLGGARSGKSALAVTLGRRHGDHVSFVATCPRLDDDLDSRIERHRAERPPWPTIEEETDLAAAIDSVPDSHMVIVDCLTLWVSNLLAAGADGETLEGAARSVADRLAARAGASIVVSNEVGLGVHPSTELGRSYRDRLGRVNAVVGRRADRVLFLAAGRAVELTDPLDILGP